MPGAELGFPPPRERSAFTRTSYSLHGAFCMCHDGGMTDADDYAADYGRGARLTLQEAAEATGMSHSTIRRHLGDFPHAKKDDVGTWRIPVQDLLGAGFHLRPKAPVEIRSAMPHGHELADARARIETLLQDLATERTRAAVAEAKVSVMTDNLEDLRRSLRALTGSPAAIENTSSLQQSAASTASPAPAPEVSPAPAEPPTPPEPKPERTRPTAEEFWSRDANYWASLSDDELEDELVYEPQRAASDPPRKRWWNRTRS
jgi:hypothetical protein